MTRDARALILSAQDAVEFIEDRIRDQALGRNGLDEFDLAIAIVVVDMWREVQLIDELVSSRRSSVFGDVANLFASDKRVAVAIAAALSYVAVSVAARLQEWNVTDNELYGLALIIFFIFILLARRIE